MKVMFMTSFLLFTYASGLWAAPPPKLTFKDHGKVIKELTLEQLNQIVPSEKIKITDALESDDIEYEGYPVSALIEKIYGKNKNEAEELLFTCLDGYQPSVPLKQFEEREGYLVFRRIDSNEFSIINKREGNKKINVGPFYLVWKKRNPSMPHEESSWPYQVATLDMVNFTDAFPKLAPPKGSSNKVIRGFLAFRNNCVGCHTLNGDGGKGGRNLITPSTSPNIIKKTGLRNGISDPTSIRFKTGMPGLDKNMPAREAVIEDIINYFKAMAKNKIKPSGKFAKALLEKVPAIDWPGPANSNEVSHC